FAAGSWPARSSGLNRFGVLREAVVEDQSGKFELAYAGLLTAFEEKTVDDARKAFLPTGRGTSVTVASGEFRNGRAWARTEKVEVSRGCGWTEAAETLTNLLNRESESSFRESAAESVCTFLVVMRQAALSAQPSFRSSFLHHGKLYCLETRWRSSAGAL